MKLKVTGIGFSYEDRKVLENINFEIKEGEFVSLLGTSGGGKSTILKLLAGILKPDEGSIFANGEEICEISSRFAYMPQNDLLFPWKDVLDNVCLYGRIHKKEEEMKKEAMEAMEAFGLAGYEHSYPSALSGGMRQRAAFLRTMLCQAEILLLDEPFGALDVITRGEMQEWLLSMRDKMKKTVLLVTHDMDEAIYLSDRILILGGNPAGIRAELSVPEGKRDRHWLYGQGELRRQIYDEIR